jgi:hypothetical protein
MTRAATIANSTYRAICVPSSPVEVAAGSRFRFGFDHALRKEDQSDKQAEETNKEKKHEDDLKHLRLSVRMTQQTSCNAWQALIGIKGAPVSIYDARYRGYITEVI